MLSDTRNIIISRRWISTLGGMPFLLATDTLITLAFKVSPTTMRHLS
jgi:hypothetical protein